MRTSNAVLVLAALGAMGGCGQNKPLPRDVVQAFEQAYNKDDAEASAALFTEDAQILPQQGPVISGREKIREYLAGEMLPIISFNTETEMSLMRGDIAIEQGVYRVRDVRRGSEVEMGKFLHVWKRVGPDWKLYRVMYNTDMAPDTEVSVAEAAEEDPVG